MTNDSKHAAEPEYLLLPCLRFQICVAVLSFLNLICTQSVDNFLQKKSRITHDKGTSWLLASVLCEDDEA